MALGLLAGCGAVKPEPIPVAATVIACPDLEPPGKCVPWTPIYHPHSVLECNKDAINGAYAVNECLEWIEEWKAAYTACKESLE